MPLENIIDQHIFYHLTVVKKNIIGERIRQARKAANPPITQKDLVARLEVQGMTVDQSGISKIESGLRPITDIEVIFLTRALKVSIAWLFQEEIGDID
jgi:transcriptional regulator with XRE-family HTH domain